jgi:ABC-type multidrug transport system permease subunit
VVVGTTFSLGYQEFEARELAVGVIRHGNSSYADMIIRAVETVDDAREDLMTERIDTIIEVDPWIDEKFVDLKKAWIAVHADETRPLLTAAIQVVMLQAKQQVVDEAMWDYLEPMMETVLPRVNSTIGSLKTMLEEGLSGPEVEEALALLAKLEGVEDETVRVMAIVTEEGLREIVENGTIQEKLVVSMIDRSAIVGTLYSLAEAKPVLDACYHFLRYAYPYLSEPGVLPRELAGDLNSFVGNLSAIKPAQATLIRAALPLLEPRVADGLRQENPTWSSGEVERATESIISGASELMATVESRHGDIVNLSNRLSEASSRLSDLDIEGLLEEGGDLIQRVGKMEQGFLTSPIYVYEKPLYFGSETKRYVDYISPGIFAFGILFSVLVYTVLSVVRDREKGILRRIFVCNVSRWSYVGGKCLTCLVISAIQMTILMVCAVLIFDIYIVSLPKTFVLGLYSSISFVGLGLLISSVTKTELEALTASFGVVFVMLMVSGVFYPFELSPSIIRQASAYIPVTYVADLLKAGIIKDAPVGEIAWDLLSVGVYGGATVLIGALAFSWRKKG